MIIVKATPESEAKIVPSPDEGVLAAIASYHQELARAGALLDAAGLTPSAKGWRIRYEGSTRSVSAGPFSETSQLLAGDTLIQARNREEALAWSRRYPNPRGEGVSTEIEVRQLYELGDFAPSATIDRLKSIGLPT